MPLTSAVPGLRHAAATTLLLVAALAPLPAVSVAPTAAAAAKAAPRVKVINGCLKSKPEPGSRKKIDLCYTVFKPARASSSRPVPMIMHSHGWGGSRSTTRSAFARFTGAGYGVISFDQRGWGESGGRSHVASPAYEGVDVRTLVRFVSTLRWVEQDRPGDPRLGAIGGSYGGAYQLLGAFEELRRTGRAVFDAIAPEITWNDVGDAVAPDGLVRTAWAEVLAADSVPQRALAPAVHRALALARDTGRFPDPTSGVADLESFFARNGPQWQARQGRRLAIPVLLGQGTTDSLFPLQEGLRTWRSALSARSRSRSIFVGYNGGHLLPAAQLAGTEVVSDPCSAQLAGGDFEQLTLRFFDEQLKGRDRGLTGYGRLHLATPDATCLTVRSAGVTDTVALGTVTSAPGSGQHGAVVREVAAGPLTLAGTPYLTGAVSVPDADDHAFYGLAVGPSPAEARLVHGAVLPVAATAPVAGLRRRVDLPSVAVRVPSGQYLYLWTSPTDPTFPMPASRAPGVVTIDDTVVHLPVVGD